MLSNRQVLQRKLPEPNTLSMAEYCVLYEDDLWMNRMGQTEAEILDYSWEFWGRPDQQPPEEEWYIWLLLTGRGWGKNRTLSEWAHIKAWQMPGSHGGVCARTAADVRDTVIGGISGILATAKPWNPVEYSPGNRELRWANGTTAHTYSSEEPDQLRGPNHHWFLADELSTWKRKRAADGGTAWDHVQFSTRIDYGDENVQPQIAAAMTPRPTKEVRELVADKRTVITRGTLTQNILNLSPLFVEKIIEKYGGTRLGRQEIGGELLDAIEGALVTVEMIDDNRVEAMPDEVEFVRTGTGIDPAVTSGDNSDETGIITACLGSDGHLYVFSDRSGRYTSEGWARRAIEARDSVEGEDIVAEVNNGGDLVEDVIRNYCDKEQIPVRVHKVHASRGKHVRFGPLALLYEQGRVHHVGPPGKFDELEDQVCSFTEEGYEGDHSPDRADALVWIAKHLMDRRRNRVRWDLVPTQ